MRIHRRRDGTGAPVVLVHSVACDLSLWDTQTPTLADRYHVLRYDVRGHGKSELPGPSFTFEELADDLDGLLAECQIASAHVVGLSMGGVIARLLALRHPKRARSLVLCSTMAFLPPTGAKAWRERAALVRDRGIGAIVESSLAHWFTPDALAANTPAVEQVRNMLRAASPDAYLAICTAVPALNFFPRQGDIGVPTLVAVGALDPNLSALDPESLAGAIPGARLKIFPNTGHFPNLEAPEEFNRALLEFFQSVS